MSVAHIHFILLLLLSVSFSFSLPPTGTGGNPNGGSGFPSGIWILAGCQGRYAWSPPEWSQCDGWAKHAHTHTLFSRPPLPAFQTAIFPLIPLKTLRHKFFLWLPVLGHDTLLEGSCDILEKCSAAPDSHRHTKHKVEKCPHWLNQPPPTATLQLLNHHPESQKTWSSLVTPLYYRQLSHG